MSKSSEYAILVNAEERERQALAQREQDYFNTLYIEGKLPKPTPKTADKAQLKTNGNHN